MDQTPGISSDNYPMQLINKRTFSSSDVNNCFILKIKMSEWPKCKICNAKFFTQMSLMSSDKLPWQKRFIKRKHNLKNAEVSSFPANE